MSSARWPDKSDRGGAFRSPSRYSIVDVVDSVWYHASDVAMLSATGRPQLVEFFQPDANAGSASRRRLISFSFAPMARRRLRPKGMIPPDSLRRTLDRLLAPATSVRR